MKDQFGREIDYMRISITDRCNLRCRYCMPAGMDNKLPMSEILTYEEIAGICEAAIQAGIRKFKITGGEPLVRPDADALIGMIKKLPGTDEVTMTTNGVTLARHLPGLVRAGLDAVNVSLDTLDPVQYRQITGVDALQQVLAGIKAALSAGLKVKINAVLQRDLNMDAWRSLIELAKDHPLDVRFIEMMPIGAGKSFSPVYGEEILEKIKKSHPDMEDDERKHGNGPASYVYIPGWKGSIGFISAMHGKFCRDCNRIRLTSTGKLKPCLCYGEVIDLMPVLRQETDEAQRRTALLEALQKAVFIKPQAHQFEYSEKISENHRMAEIGG